MHTLIFEMVRYKGKREAGPSSSKTRSAISKPRPNHTHITNRKVIPNREYQDHQKKSHININKNKNKNILNSWDDKSQIAIDGAPYEKEIFERITKLTRLGIPFDQVLSKTGIEFERLKDIYDRLLLPVNVNDDLVLLSVRSHSAEQNSNLKAEKESYKRDNVDDMINNQKNAQIPLLINNRGAYSKSPSPPNTDINQSEVNIIAKPSTDVLHLDKNDEQLSINFYEQVSRNLMKLRLDFLKLKSALHDRVPKLDEFQKASLRKKKNLLISDIEKFYESMHMNEDKSSGFNEDFIGLSDSALDKEDFEETNVPSISMNLSNKTNHPTSQKQVIDNPSDDPPEIISDSVIKLKRSKPDQFTPYHSLNLSKSISPNI